MLTRRHALFCALQVLEDIFILRVVKGSDFFCIVSGSVAAAALEEAKAMYAAAAAAVTAAASAIPHIKQLKGSSSSFYRSAKDPPPTVSSPDKMALGASTKAIQVPKRGSNISARGERGDSDDEDEDGQHVDMGHIYGQKDEV